MNNKIRNFLAITFVLIAIVLTTIAATTGFVGVEYNPNNNCVVQSNLTICATHTGDGHGLTNLNATGAVIVQTNGTTLNSGATTINITGSGAATITGTTSGGTATVNVNSSGGGGGGGGVSNAVIVLTADVTGTNIVVNLANATNYANLAFTFTLVTNAWVTIANGAAAAGMPFTIDWFQNLKGTNQVHAATSNWWAPSALYLTPTTNSLSWTKWSCQVNPYGTNVMVISSLSITNQ